MREPVPFGKYLLLDRISVGGMAEVFRAKSYGVEGFQKVVAIKRILPSMGEDRDFIKMFVDEAKIAGQLAHANIGQIFELGRIQGAHFIAMEYIWGKDLLEIQSRFRKRKQVMPVPMACYIIAKVCEGLDYAHRKRDALGNPLQIIHRDCSPQNVLVSYQGEVKVIDFGIAKAATRMSRTNAGTLKGKFGYMSPEQVRGLPLDRRSDIFALGTVFYETLTGERLFLGETDFSTLERLRNADVAPPRKINPNIPEQVERIVMRALARDPDDRYQWCSEMLADLKAHLTHQKQMFTAKGLGEWVRDAFSTELARERELMAEYRRIGPDGKVWDEHAQTRAGDPNAQTRAGDPNAQTRAGDPNAQTRAGDPNAQTRAGDPNAQTRAGDAEVLVSAPQGKRAHGGAGSGAAAGPGAFVDDDDGGFGDDGPTEIFGEIGADALLAHTDGELPADVADVDGVKVVVDPDGPATVAESGSARRRRSASEPENVADIEELDEGDVHLEPEGGDDARARERASSAAEPPPPALMARAVATPAGISLQPALGPVETDQLSARTQRTQRRRRRKRMALVRDIGIGIAIAGFLLGVFAAGKYLAGGSSAPAPPKTGAVAVTVGDRKPADVYVDGARAGTTADGALAIEGVKPGKHVIRVARGTDALCERSVAVGAGKVGVVACAARQPAPGALVLDGVPAGAAVTVDDRPAGVDPAHEAILLAAGRNHVVVVRDGDEVLGRFQLQVAPGVAVRRTVGPAAGGDSGHGAPPPADRRRGSHSHHHHHRDRQRGGGKPAARSGSRGAAAARPPHGYFTADTKPWAHVFIDGHSTGKMTPIVTRAEIPLAPGRHHVTFVVRGRKYSYWVRIAAGKTTHLSKTLAGAE